jgi:hypothetical protein
MATLLRNSLLSTATSVDTKNQQTPDITPPKPPPPDSGSLLNIQDTSAPAPAPSRGSAPVNLTSLQDIYNQFQNDVRKQTLGNDPFLQQDTINKINQFLNTYPSSKASVNYKDATTGPWTDLPVKTLYYKTIHALIDIINDFSEILSNMDSDDSTTTRRKLVKALFQKDRRVYVGMIFIFLSFVLYFIDAAV